MHHVKEIYFFRKLVDKFGHTIRNVLQNSYIKMIFKIGRRKWTWRIQFWYLSSISDVTYVLEIWNMIRFLFDPWATENWKSEPELNLVSWSETFAIQFSSLPKLVTARLRDRLTDRLYMHETVQNILGIEFKS